MKNVFVTCALGLEELLCQELEELGMVSIKPGFKGVYVEDAAMDDVYRINYCSRIAGRVLVPIKQFRCRDRKVLYQNCSEIDWLSYIPRGKTFAIDANVKNPQLRNSLFAAQVMKDAICDQFREKFGERPDVDTRQPDVQLNLFIQNEAAIVSFDSSGVPLNKRGYRIENVPAPIQENLAAALLRISGYKGNENFCDPCCGSGTFLIEAAMIASATPPGFLRDRWGFMHLPEYSQAEWLRVKTSVDQKRVPLSRGKFFGCDTYFQAIKVCKNALRAAGFLQDIIIQNADFQDVDLPFLPNFVIANPPHGLRLGEVDQLRPMYRALGDFLKRKTDKPARGFIFTGNLELAKEVGLSAKRRYVINNSGVDSRLLEFDLY